MPSSTCRSAVAGALLLLLALLARPSTVVCQTYSPIVASLSSCSSSTASLVTLGDLSIDNSYPTQFNDGNLGLTAFNNSLFGATISQLSMQLGDNTANTFPTHLRMGVYTVGAAVAGSTQVSMSLVAQTDELTVYPSGAQLLTANLQQPLKLLSGGQYAIGMYADSQLSVYLSSVNSLGFNGYSNFGYIDIAMPGTISPSGPSAYSALAMAATGCLDSSTLAAPGTALYYLCAYAEQYAPAASTTDYTQVSVTSTLSVSGVVTVSTAASSTGGYPVQSFSGTLSTSLSGQGEYYSPYFTTNSINLAASASNKIKGAAPSNLLYPTGAASVDGNGLSFVGSNGVQYILQWSSTLKQYQIVSSSIAVSASKPVVASGSSVTAITMSSTPTFGCTPAQTYTPPTVPSCPSGYQSMALADLDATGAVPSYAQTDYQQSLYGNVLYFRPFSTVASGTLVQSLSVYLGANPGTVLHMRLGLYALNGSISSPSWTLLGQTAEQIIANAAGGVITVPLASALTVQAGAYSVGVWFDQPVYASATSWSATPYPTQLSQLYTSLSTNGQLPSYVIPAQGYQMPVVGALTCVPTTATTQFSFCAAFTTQYGQNDTTSGTLTVLSTTQTNSFGSYYVVIGGNASRTDATGSTYVLTPATLTNPTVQRLYVPSSTKQGLSLDSNGLQFAYYMYGVSMLTVSAQPIPNTPASQYAGYNGQSYGSPTMVNVGPGEFSYQPYTTGNPLPTCIYTPVAYANLLTPPSQPPPVCALSAVNITLGDSLIADYSKQAEGNSVPALTVYTNSFTVAVSGVVVSQMAVSILANTAQSLNVYLGVYSSTGALLGSTPLLSWQQAYDQQVLATLNAPLTLSAGKYYAALVSDGPLNIATSTTLSPSATVSALGSGLPATISLTGSSAGAVPLTVLGCASAAYSFCSTVQYYTPISVSATGPTTTTYLYQGLLTGVTNADGSVSAQVVNAHGTVVTRFVYYGFLETIAYTELTLAAPSTVYPSKAQALDGTGLLLTSSTLGISVNLSYSTALGQYMDTWGTLSLPGSQIVTSVFNLTALSSSNAGIPSCSVSQLPSTISPSPAPLSCSSGSSAVTLGDDISTDYGSDTEEYNYNGDNFLITSLVSTGNSSVLLSQVAVGINVNHNTLAKLRFAVYDFSMNLLSPTNEVTVTNPGDSIVIGSLATPVLLPSNSSYYLALWIDTALYMGFSLPYSQYCYEIPYVSSQGFPASLTTAPGSLGAECATVALAGLGCTAPAGSSSSNSTTNPPTGSATTTSSGGGSNDVSLSKGAVAGIVIGCVVGSNLLLLVCLFLLFGLGRKSTNNGAVSKSRMNSEREPASRVELATAEPSQYGAKE